jgi:hypothetical protein
MALTAAQRAERNRQIEAAQAAIRAGESIRAQDIVNSMIGRNVGGAANALQNAINNIPAPTPIAAPLVPLNPTKPPTTTTPTSTAQDDYYNWLKGEQQRQARDTATSFLKGILTEYGMESLSGQVENLINTWGTNTGVIAEKLRQTDEYATRFKGLKTLQGKGITDVRNEAEYIDLESRYRTVFRENGIQNYLGDAGSQAEIDSLAEIIGDYTLSVTEVADRISDAQRVVANTDPNVRAALNTYYGISDTDLVEYSLDQERTMKRFNTMANAAVFGGYAATRGLDVSSGVAESVASLAADDDIDDARRMTQLNSNLQAAESLAQGAQRLASLSNTTFSDDEAVEAQFELDLDADKKVKKLASQERARFGGQSALSRTSLAQRKAR